MTRTVEEILGKDSIAKLQEPIETARGLPRAAYTTQEFYDLVTRVTAERRLDMFSRQQRNGFEVWGNEI